MAEPGDELSLRRLNAREAGTGASYTIELSKCTGQLGLNLKAGVYTEGQLVHLTLKLAELKESWDGTDD